MKIIVTGGAGFIGSHIVDALIQEGYEVHIVDNMSAGKESNVNKKAVFHKVDIRDKDSLIPIFKDIDYVFHEAAMPQVQYSIENPIETNENNVNGLLNVLEASRLNGIKRVVFASSCAIYGNQETLPIVESMEANPLSPYAVHKYVGEIYMKLYSEIYGVETVCLRYFNVYGSRQSADGAYASVIPKFIEFRKNNKPLIITGDGDQTRDFVNVKDVVSANILAMKSDKVGKGEIINIGTGGQYSVNQIAKLVGGEIEYIPPRVEPKFFQAGIKKANELLNWEPKVKLEEAVVELKNESGIL
ncbi:MAG TPA: NAD-dependent epimerase/dehydratase family protein [Candidatus Paceibacterota bacterium]|nr:NAD-dependent epimerase/dehydratase family protein [Candidatus Paceibacterota bacterium]